MPTLKHEVFPRIALHYTKYDQSTLTGHIQIKLIALRNRTAHS